MKRSCIFFLRSVFDSLSIVLLKSIQMNMSLSLNNLILVLLPKSFLVEHSFRLQARKLMFKTEEGDGELSPRFN